MTTVLLVDDHPVVREGLRGMIDAEHDLTVVGEAGSGAEAIAMAESLRPDVILMDLTLPLMDGFTATKLIRQNDELKNVPIIAITAHKENDFRSDAKASGFDAYVTKPIDVNWLKELIAGLMI